MIGARSWLGLLLGVAVAGCSSVKPPPPKPPPLRQAERFAAEAARLSELGNWSAAAREWQRAVDQYSLLNDADREAIALHNLAQAERELGRRAEADAHLREAARLNERAGNSREWWRNQITLLQVEAESGRTNQVATRMSDLLQQTNRIEDPAVRGLFLNELGLSQQRHGQLADAQSSFTQAQSIFRRMDDRRAGAIVLANLARLRETTGPPDEAARLWREVLAEFESLADPEGIARALAGLGRSLTAAKTDLPLAEISLRRAAHNFAMLHRTFQQRAALLSLAACLRIQGKQSEIDAVLDQVRQLDERREQLTADQ
jgi:tetratricopeptide (TPR) repeat protein